MAERSFDLPGIHELSKEQEKARLLPEKGRHLIVGGPGTGKSIVALLRAKRHQKDRDYLFLVFNRLLNEASRQMVKEQLQSRTWIHWFTTLFENNFKQPVPRLLTNQEKDNNRFDWDKILEIICESGIVIEDIPSCLIIDEGQDMPPGFYQALMNIGFENYYVVADQNQQIVEGQNSSRQDLENCLVVDETDVIELKYNYRNAYPVARLAMEFYTGDPASPPPELPPLTQTAKKAFLVEYGHQCKMDFDMVIERILIKADNNPAKLIGIITPDNKVRSRYFDKLNSTHLNFDNGKPRIVTYSYGQSADISFSEGGIFVLNYQSCKGLEFDVVFLADIHAYNCSQQYVEERKRRFYVMVARAREQVIMLREFGKNCPVDSILPEDQNVLLHWR